MTLSLWQFGYKIFQVKQPIAKNISLFDLLYSFSIQLF
jgi:hypothetical protein